MNHEHAILDRQHDQLKVVPGSVGASHEETRRVVTELDPGDGVLVSVADVVIRDLVPACRWMDLHTV